MNKILNTFSHKEMQIQAKLSFQLIPTRISIMEGLEKGQLEWLLQKGSKEEQRKK